MEVLVVDNAEPADSSFNQPLFNVISALADCKIINYTQLPAPEIIEKEFDAIILGGVPLHYSMSSIDQRASLYTWIKDTSLPVLGICLGHQVVGEVFGGEVVEMPEPEAGMVRTYLDTDTPLFAGLDDDLEIYMLHRAEVTLPEEFMRLAHTDLCQNAMMGHRTKSIYGFQFHPELTPSGPLLLDNFLQIAKKEVNDAKLAIAT